MASRERQSAELSPAPHLDVLRAAIEQASDAILITTANHDPSGSTVIFANAAFSRMTGYSADEIVGKTTNVLRGSHAHTDPAVLVRMREDLGAGREFFGSTIAYKKDGSAYDLEWRVAPVRDREGVVTHLVGIHHDVTERNMRAREEDAKDARARALLEHGVDVTYLQAHTGEILYVGPSIERVLGYTADEHAKQHPLEILHPDDAGRVQAAFGRMLMEGGDLAPIHYRLRHKNGAWRWMEGTAKNLLADPSVGAIVVSQYDVTALKEAQNARDRFFLLSVDLCCIVGFDGYFKELNPAWERTLGWTKEELLARPVVELIHPEDLEATRANAAASRKGGQLRTVENRYVCKDGSYRSFLWTAMSVPEEQTIYATARDVTERAQLESQLLHARKMEAVGRLAGGIAHDFNNMLSAILGFSNLLHEQMLQGDPMREDMNEIIQAAERASLLTRQLLAFSRKQHLAPRVVSVAAHVREMDKMLRRLIGEDVALILALAHDTGSIKVDPGQLEQVILNLVLNARDAMPDGGTITVSAASTVLDEARARHLVGTSPGPHVVLSVADTGHGMPKSVRDRVFEPFFTTKEPGRGTGLGLATVFGIVQQSGGHIDVRSAPGEGTTFEVLFPATSEPLFRSSRPPPRSALLAGKETILVVEDEAVVRQFVRRTLERNGYVVLEATMAGEALLIAEQHARDIDLLVTDVVMPRMSGPQLADRLRRAQPAMPVIYMSGYSEDASGQDPYRPGALGAGDGTDFLPKPFTPQILLAKVREVLDRLP